MSKYDIEGVTGVWMPERSQRDKQLQSTFGGQCSKETYVNIVQNGMIEPRTGKDVAMMKKFNTCKENYNGNCPYAKVTDDPYNKYSYAIQNSPAN